MSETKQYTWEEKIDNLAAIAKAVGVYIEAEEGLISPSAGHAYYHDAQRKLRELYSDFCDWRHEEPYVVDEIKALLAKYEVCTLTGEVIRGIPDNWEDE